MNMLRFAAGVGLAMGLLSAQSQAQAQYREEDAVYIYAEVGNGEGGTEGLGYHTDQSFTLTDPAQMRKGMGFTYGDVGTEVRVKASAGRFKRLSAMSTTWNSGPIALSRAYSDDTVLAGAPGVAMGEPIVYTARLKLSATTAVAPLGVPYNSAYFSATLTLGNRAAPEFYVSGNQSAEQTLRVKYTAHAGEEIDLYGSVQAFARAINVPAPVGAALTSAGLNVPARIVLSADKPGANITGRSGYVYE